MLPLGKIFSWWIYYRFKYFFFFFVQAPRNTSHLHRGAPVHSGRKAKLPGHRVSCFFFKLQQTNFQ